MKNKNIVWFAQATNRKEILLFKGTLTDQGLNVELSKKLATNANVTNLCFDGKSLCYSTKTKYYILDLMSQPAIIHHELIALSDSTSPHIVPIDKVSLLLITISQTRVLNID
jgi:ABC-type uncharacterized transport system permease subunit